MSSRIAKVVPMFLVLVLVALSAVPALAAPASQAEKDIVTIAVEDGRFTTLVAAVQAAGLADTLAGEGTFTVFAPTDDAFAKLPAGTIDALLADIPALTDILLYHVAGEKLMAADVVSMSSINTLQGQPLSVKVEGDKVMVNDAQVIITDIEASNGVIHVIDTVLLPPAAAPAELPQTGEANSANTLMVLAAIGLGLVVFGVAVRLLRPAWLVDNSN